MTQQFHFWVYIWRNIYITCIYVYGDFIYMHNRDEAEVRS